MNRIWRGIVVQIGGIEKHLVSADIPANIGPNNTINNSRCGMIIITLHLHSAPFFVFFFFLVFLSGTNMG